MNYGLNARANVLCTTYEKNTEKKEKEGGRCKREREVFFPITVVEKWKQNGDIEEKKKRAARHFIYFSCLFQ